MTPKSPAQRVADNVRAEMARNSYTQTSFATALGRSQQWLSRRLSGQVAFDIADLGEVAGALGVSIATLVGSDDIQQVSA